VREWPARGSNTRFWPIVLVGIAGILLALCAAAAVHSVGSPEPASGTVARGRLHQVDAAVTGAVALQREVDGSLAITFEELIAPSATGIHVLLVAAKDVTSDKDIHPTTSIDLGPLKGSRGMQDYWLPLPVAIPALIDRTVVLLDVATGQALAAAPLLGT
jgi:hypothetical protein